MSNFVRSIMMAVVLLAASESAHAIVSCTFFNSPKYFVGNTGTDSNCTDDTIQSALNKVASAVCPVTIYISQERVPYQQQALTISGAPHGVALVGEGPGSVCGVQIAFCDPTQGGCDNPPPTQPLLTLDAHGSPNQVGQSVLSITGNSNVTVSFLNFTHGNLSAGQGGGGIYFGGTGSLTLDTVDVTSNIAGYGAGIDFYGMGDPGTATMTLLSNVRIISNTALVDGGGIKVEGNAYMKALSPQTWIAFNHADNGGLGGGIDVVAPAQVDVASSGYNGIGVVSYNSAAYGGGTAAKANRTGVDTTVRLFTVDSENPVQVSNNTASQAGGGVYTKPFYNLSLENFIGNATFCAFDSRLENNIAPDGAAIFLDFDTSLGFTTAGQTYFNTDPQGFCSQPTSPPGAVACAVNVACNTVSGNATEDTSGNPTSGSIITVGDNPYFAVERLVMRHNEAAQLIRMIDPFASIKNCLLADNHVTAELLRLEDDGNGSPQTIDSCTIANNTIDGTVMIYSESNLSILNGLYYQPDTPMLAYSGDPSGLVFSYVLTGNTDGIPAGTLGVSGSSAPSFVNPTAGDYHLRPYSIGIDYAPATGGTDLDRVPRDVDLAPAPNVYGPRDIGAYERQYVCAADTIFCDSFEQYL